jgi:type VI secretion system protein ImpI
VLRITNTVNNTRAERTFARFPVRIGRNTLNDLNILDRFVSQFHAVLELQGRELMLRDLGSSNGTKVGGARAPAHEPTPLARHRNTFNIGPLVLECRLTDSEDAADSSSDGPPTLREHAVLEDSVVTHIHETLAFDNSAMAEARERFVAAERRPPQPPPANPSLPDDGVDGTVLIEPRAADRQRNARQARQNAQESTAATKQRKLEQLALQGVREIAQSLLPHAGPLDEPEDLIRFLSKLRDTIEVFLRCFIPLRDGYRQFASQMHIQEQVDGTVAGIESAADERDLARHLLDWTNKGGDAHRAVEGTFADLMIHQLALLHAIMRGVKSLLDALSPKSVGSSFEELEKQGKANFSWGPWRFKALWQHYGAVHGDLDDGDKRVFAALFGPEFAESYKQYRSTLDSPDT